jgi:type IV pilus assembly protein PilO
MWPILNKILRLPIAIKLLIPVGIIIIISGGYYGLLYRSHQKKLVQLKGEHLRIKAERAEKKIIANNLEKYKAEFAKTKEELNKALVQLPSEKEIPKLLSDISALGSTSGLGFLLFKPSNKEVPIDFYAEIPIEIKVMGNYHEVAVFFDRISRLQRIVNISEVKMENPKNIEGKMILTTSCRAITYKYLSEEERVRIEKERRAAKGKKRR